MGKSKVQPINYYWTNADDVILKGDTKGSAQGAFVTPYGIPPKSLYEGPSPVVDSPIEVDLAWSFQGESARATRFYVAGDWTHPQGWAPKGVWSANTWPEQTTKHDADPWASRHNYEWVQVDEQTLDGIQDIKALCKRLVELDGNLYPRAIYGITTGDYTVNAAKMLFDYWGNSRHRAAVVGSTGFDWKGHYVDDASGLPLVWRTKATTRIEWVLRKKSLIQMTPVGPSSSTKRSFSELSSGVRAYVGQIETSIETIDWLLQGTAKKLEERSRFLTELTAVKAIATASMACPRADNLPAKKLKETLDEILPKARDRLFGQPIALGETRTFVGKPSAWATQLLEQGAAQHPTHVANARDAMKAEAAKLANLLLTNAWYAEQLKEWAADALPDLLLANDSSFLDSIGGPPVERPKPTDNEAPLPPYAALPPPPQAVTPQTEAWEIALRLERAIARGVYALSECNAAYADMFIKHFDDAPHEHAKAAGDVTGDVPVAVALKLFGKSYGLAKKISKIGPAILRVHATREIATLGRKALAISKQSPRFGAKACEAFYEGIIARLPEEIPAGEGGLAGMKLRAEAELVLINRDEKGLDAFAKKIAKKQHDEPAAWKNMAAVLDIVNLMVTIGTASDTGSTAMNINLMTDLAGNVGSVAIGSVDRVLKVIGGAEDVLAKLEKIGGAFGFVTSITGFVTGWVSFHEQVDKGDWGSAAATGFATVGGVATGLVGLCAWLETLGVVAAATGPVGLAVEAFATACALVAGAISVTQIVVASKPATNRVCYSIVQQMRSEPVWMSLAETDAHVHEWMNGVVRICEEETLHLAPRAEAPKLRAAAVPADSVDQICDFEGAVERDKSSLSPVGSW